MTSSWNRLSDHHTFSQRYDYEPLPKPMRLEEISEDSRRETFNAIRGLFSGTGTASIAGYLSNHGEFVGDGDRFVERTFGKWFGTTEDMFMFGACASFAACLTSKHRQVGQGPNSQ